MTWQQQGFSIGLRTCSATFYKQILHLWKVSPITESYFHRGFIIVRENSELATKILF